MNSFRNAQGCNAIGIHNENAEYDYADYKKTTIYFCGLRIFRYFCPIFQKEMSVYAETPIRNREGAN